MTRIRETGASLSSTTNDGTYHATTSSKRNTLDLRGVIGKFKTNPSSSSSSHQHNGNSVLNQIIADEQNFHLHPITEQEGTSSEGVNDLSFPVPPGRFKVQISNTTAMGLKLFSSVILRADVSCQSSGSSIMSKDDDQLCNSDNIEKGGSWSTLISTPMDSQQSIIRVTLFCEPPDSKCSYKITIHQIFNVLHTKGFELGKGEENDYNFELPMGQYHILVHSVNQIPFHCTYKFANSTSHSEKDITELKILPQPIVAIIEEDTDQTNLTQPLNVKVSAFSNKPVKGRLLILQSIGAMELKRMLDSEQRVTINEYKSLIDDCYTDKNVESLTDLETMLGDLLEKKGLRYQPIHSYVQAMKKHLIESQELEKEVKELVMNKSLKSSQLDQMQSQFRKLRHLVEKHKLDTKIIINLSEEEKKVTHYKEILKRIKDYTSRLKEYVNQYDTSTLEALLHDISEDTYLQDECCASMVHSMIEEPESILKKLKIIDSVKEDIEKYMMDEDLSQLEKIKKQIDTTYDSYERKYIEKEYTRLDESIKKIKTRLHAEKKLREAILTKQTHRIGSDIKAFEPYLKGTQILRDAKRIMEDLLDNGDADISKYVNQQETTVQNSEDLNPITRMNETTSVQSVPLVSTPSVITKTVSHQDPLKLPLDPMKETDVLSKLLLEDDDLSARDPTTSKSSLTNPSSSNPKNTSIESSLNSMDKKKDNLLDSILAEEYDDDYEEQTTTPIVASSPSAQISNSSIFNNTSSNNNEPSVMISTTLSKAQTQRTSTSSPTRTIPKTSSKISIPKRKTKKATTPTTTSTTSMNVHPNTSNSSSSSGSDKSIVSTPQSPFSPPQEQVVNLNKSSLTMTTRQTHSKEEEELSDSDIENISDDEDDPTPLSKPVSVSQIMGAIYGDVLTEEEIKKGRNETLSSAHSGVDIERAPTSGGQEAKQHSYDNTTSSSQQQPPYSCNSATSSEITTTATATTNVVQAINHMTSALNNNNHIQSSSTGTTVHTNHQRSSSNVIVLKPNKQKVCAPSSSLTAHWETELKQKESVLLERFQSMVSKPIHNVPDINNKDVVKLIAKQHKISEHPLLNQLHHEILILINSNGGDIQNNGVITITKFDYHVEHDIVYSPVVASGRTLSQHTAQHYDNFIKTLTNVCLNRAKKKYFGMSERTFYNILHDCVCDENANIQAINDPNLRYMNVHRIHLLLEYFNSKKFAQKYQQQYQQTKDVTLMEFLLDIGELVDIFNYLCKYCSNYLKSIFEPTSILVDSTHRDEFLSIVELLCQMSFKLGYSSKSRDVYNINTYILGSVEKVQHFIKVASEISKFVDSKKVLMIEDRVYLAKFARGSICPALENFFKQGIKFQSVMKGYYHIWNVILELYYYLQFQLPDFVKYRLNQAIEEQRANMDLPCTQSSQVVQLHSFIIQEPPDP
ncbi:hypothetical protein C9374_012800 [Naegleria lovaniensis]|uniref:Uncharacterized protein n=1 Tax=Naegleria lovaniensis TaxID=51637 RepID=A0AA88GE56_NAELO|nr:uncharacterized protein C9374_012800 [Naegleria lovaniensis]KAG2373198.1 hypothetical protein C9374_012800 [Naegleria lovaniensis]